MKQAAGATYPMPEVTAPVVIDRWMPHAHFNHAKHQSVSCKDCHTAAQSSHLTPDVLMPTKESCTSCHSPKGTAMNASECMTCHTYHAPDPRPAAPVTASSNSFKQMLHGGAPYHLAQFRARAQTLLTVNRELLDAFLDRRTDLECFRPPAGSVVFPRLREGDAEAFVPLLREKYETSVVPGRFFGMPQHFRIGFSGDPSELCEGLERLGSALDKFRG